MAKKRQSKTTNGKQSQPHKKESGKELSIEYIFPEDQHAFFSNYATVQREGQEFHISFFQIRPPLLIGNEEERKEQLKDLNSVQAHCLTRVVVSSERAEGLVRALIDQLEKSKKETSEPDKAIVVPKKHTASDSQRDSSKKK